MLPSVQTVASRHSSPHEKARPQTEKHGLRQKPVLPISMAQECVEVPSGLSEFTYVHNHFDEPSSKHVCGEANSDIIQNQKLARVKLVKSPSPTHESAKYFVRTAGGMSVPVPKLPPDRKRLLENHQTNSVAPQPVPQLQDGSLTEVEIPAIIPPPRSTTNQITATGNSYLPLSMIAGRGQTGGTPSEGNKNSANSKVRSLPPSHTLAMSASFIRSYFTSGPEKQQQSKSAGTTPDTEMSVKTKVMGLWNNVKYGE